MQGGNTNYGKDSGCRRRHIDAVLQGTRDGRRNRRARPLRAGQTPERHIRRPLILVERIPRGRRAGRRPGRRIRAGRRRPAARHGDPRQARQRHPRCDAVERHQFGAPGCGSDRKARRSARTKRRAGRPNRPRQAALGQGRRLLPRRLLHADQGGMGGRERARKRQENRRHLPTSRLAELAHRRLRPGRRRRGRPS